VHTYHMLLSKYMVQPSIHENFIHLKEVYSADNIPTQL